MHDFGEETSPRFRKTDVRASGFKNSQDAIDRRHPSG
jgi:hypothetical protein